MEQQNKLSLYLWLNFTAYKVKRIKSDVGKILIANPHCFLLILSPKVFVSVIRGAVKTINLYETGKFDQRNYSNLLITCCLSHVANYQP